LGPANEALGDHRPDRLAADEERAASHHVVLHVPVGDGGLEQRLRDREARVVHDEVDAAEGQDGRPDRRRDLCLVGDVRADTDGDVRPADLGRHGPRGVLRDVGDDDARPLGRETVRDGLADARTAAGHERDPGRQRFRLRHPLELRLL
jgi:hypothetical protein